MRDKFPTSDSSLSVHFVVGLSAIVVEHPTISNMLEGVRLIRLRLRLTRSQVPVDQFKFLTRLHYAASDSVTYGEGAEWGEHEIDYILFIKANVTLSPNPEEVGDVKYVTLPKLKEMMDPGSGLKWSPWFRIIVDKFADDWWADLDVTLSTDKFVDVKTIHHVL